VLSAGKDGFSAALMKLEQHYCAWFRCEFSFVVQQEHPETLF